jgi:cobalt-zinc-cadmium efflux system membrane fusion protein
MMRSAAARGLLVGLVLALSACRSGQESAVKQVESGQAKGPASASVPWVRARSAAGATLLEVPAKIITSPEVEGSVSAPSPARVMRVRVQAGQTVSRGGAVVDVVMPQLLEAAADVGGAEAKIEAWSKRMTQLEALEKEGLARLGDQVEAATQLAEARAVLERARATLLGAGLSLSDGKAMLAGDGVVALRAPVSGVVVEVDARPGEVRSGPEPFARIVGRGELRVEARLGRVPDEDTRFSFVTIDGQKWGAKLVSQSPSVDPRDGTSLAWFTLSEKAALPAGTPGVVRMEPQGDGSIVVLPVRAVRLGAEGGQVYRRGREGLVPMRVVVIASSVAEVLVRAAPGDVLEEGAEVASDAGAVEAEEGSAP